jgi:hypothetical protein
MVVFDFEGKVTDRQAHKLQLEMQLFEEVPRN